MRMPVLIPARGEQQSIAIALNALSSEIHEPIVIINGESDGTAEVAASYNATVLRSEEGKMLAFQAGIKYLGHRATDPFITLDADSHPLFPKHWSNELLRARHSLTSDRPAVVAGLLLYTNIGMAHSIAETGVRTARQLLNRRKNNAGIFSGANMLLHLQNMDAVEGVLELNNVWPGQDRAVKDKCIEFGGQTIKAIHPASFVITDGLRYQVPWKHYFKKGETRKRVAHSFTADAPPGSQPYDKAYYRVSD